MNGYEQTGLESIEPLEQQRGAVSGELAPEARISAGLVGMRSGLRGRALAVIMAAVGAIQMSCDPSMNAGRDMDPAGVEDNDLSPDFGNPSIIRMEDKVKIVGSCNKVAELNAQLVDAGGRVLADEAHSVGPGSYTVEIQLINSTKADSANPFQPAGLKLVDDNGRGFTVNFADADSIPEMPGR